MASTAHGHATRGARRNAVPRPPERSAAVSHEQTRSVRLRAALRRRAAPYFAASAKLWSHPRLRDIFPDYLYRIHSIIRASVPVMEAARDRAAVLAAADPAAASLHDYLAHHVPEERHHDDWLLDDIAVLGVPPERVWARRPSPIVAKLVGAQYYYIHHHDPVAVLGYIAVLEGTPPEESHIRDIMNRTGLPPKAFRTFIKHARLDPHHRDDLNDQLDSIPLSPTQEQLVFDNALETQAWLARSLHETLRQANRRR